MMVGKKNNWILHVVGIILFLSFPILDLAHHLREANKFSFEFFKHDITRYILTVCFFYLCYFYLIDKCFFTKKYVWFAIVVVISILFIGILPDLLFGPPPRLHHFSNPNFIPPKPRIHRYFPLKAIERSSFKVIAVIMFALLLKIYLRLKKTQEEKTLAELSFLRTQVNPHFLFNSLNSIYSLALVKSDQAPEAIATLSDMMRYVLNENEENWVSLEKEINYVKDYIELQKLRITGATTVEFKINGDYKQKQIAPLILIPFIENAFKYGINPNHKSTISIQIDIKEKQLEMQVKNEKVAVQHDATSGLGIKNVMSRLNLIYPNSHNLEITENSNNYQVKLNINL